MTGGQTPTFRCVSEIKSSEDSNPQRTNDNATLGTRLSEANICSPFVSGTPKSSISLENAPVKQSPDSLLSRSSRQIIFPGSPGIGIESCRRCCTTGLTGWSAKSARVMSVMIMHRFILSERSQSDTNFFIASLFQVTDFSTPWGWSPKLSKDQHSYTHTDRRIANQPRQSKIK